MSTIMGLQTSNSHYTACYKALQSHLLSQYGHELTDMRSVLEVSGGNDPSKRALLGGKLQLLNTALQILNHYTSEATKEEYTALMHLGEKVKSVVELYRASKGQHQTRNMMANGSGVPVSAAAATLKRLSPVRAPPTNGTLELSLDFVKDIVKEEQGWLGVNTGASGAHKRAQPHRHASPFTHPEPLLPSTQQHRSASRGQQVPSGSSDPSISDQKAPSLPPPPHFAAGNGVSLDSQSGPPAHRLLSSNSSDQLLAARRALLSGGSARGFQGHAFTQSEINAAEAYCSAMYAAATSGGGGSVGGSGSVGRTLSAKRSASEFEYGQALEELAEQGSSGRPGRGEGSEGAAVASSSRGRAMGAAGNSRSLSCDGSRRLPPGRSCPEGDLQNMLVSAGLRPPAPGAGQGGSAGLHGFSSSSWGGGPSVKRRTVAVDFATAAPLTSVPLSGPDPIGVSPFSPLARATGSSGPDQVAAAPWQGLDLQPPRNQAGPRLPLFASLGPHNHGVSSLRLSAPPTLALPDDPVLRERQRQWQQLLMLRAAQKQREFAASGATGATGAGAGAGGGNQGAVSMAQSAATVASVLAQRKLLVEPALEGGLSVTQMLLRGLPPDMDADGGGAEQHGSASPPVEVCRGSSNAALLEGWREELLQAQREQHGATPEQAGGVESSKGSGGAVGAGGGEEGELSSGGQTLQQGSCLAAATARLHLSQPDQAHAANPPPPCTAPALSWQDLPPGAVPVMNTPPRMSSDGGPVPEPSLSSHHQQLQQNPRGGGTPLPPPPSSAAQLHPEGSKFSFGTFPAQQGQAVELAFAAAQAAADAPSSLVPGADVQRTAVLGALVPETAAGTAAGTGASTPGPECPPMVSAFAAAVSSSPAASPRDLQPLSGPSADGAVQQPAEGDPLAAAPSLAAFFDASMPLQAPSLPPDFMDTNRLDSLLLDLGPDLLADLDMEEP